MGDTHARLRLGYPSPGDGLPTLTFIPKILAVVTVLILALPWIMNMLIAFTNDVFGMFSVIH